MSGIIKSLMVKVGVDLTEMQKGFKQAGKELKAVGKDFTKVGTSMTRGLTLPIVGAGVAAVKFASDTEESLNKVRVAFGGSAKQVEDFADTTLESFGIARGTALDMAATFGDMGTSMGLTSGEAADMSISMTGLAGDLASFKNIGIDEAVTALNGVFTGETESLKRLGIVMLDATLETYRLEKGITKSYKSMSQAEKVALRYEYVMNATKNAQGDFVRTGGGVANQLRVVQESLKQAAAALGEDLLPFVADALKKVNALIKSFTNMDDGTKKLIITIGGILAIAGPLMLAFGKINTMLGTLFTGVSSAIKIIQGGGGLTAAITAIIGPAGWAVLAIGAIVGAVLLMRDESAEATKEVKKLSDQFDKSEASFIESGKALEGNKTVAMELTAKLDLLNKKEKLTNEEKAEMAMLVGQLNKLYPDLSLEIDKTTGKLNTEKKALDEVIEAMYAQQEMDRQQSHMLDLYSKKQEHAESYRKALARLTKAQEDYDFAVQSQSISVDGFAHELSEARKGLDLAYTQMEKTETALYNSEEAWKDLAKSVSVSTDDIVSSATELNEQEKDLMDDYLQYMFGSGKTRKQILEDRKKVYEDYFKKYEDIQQTHLDNMGGLEDKGITKTKLTAKQIKANLEQQVKDFQNWRTQIQALASKVPDDVLTELKALGPSFAPVIKELNGMTSTELNKWVAVWRSKGKAASDAAKEDLKGLPEEMAVLGVNAGLAFAAGIKNALRAVKKAAGENAQAAVDRTKQVAEIKSPSKVMLGLGSYMSEGFAIGIKDNIGMIKDSAVEMSEAAVPTVSRPAFGATMEQSTSGDIEMGVFRAVSQAMGQQKTGDHFVIQIGGKTILDTVITEKQRRDSRAGKSIALTV